MDEDRMIDLERADAARKALESAAQELERYSTNDVYQRAFKLGARIIRKLKDDLSKCYRDSNSNIGADMR